MNAFYMDKIVAVLTEMRDALTAVKLLLERPPLIVQQPGNPRLEAERHFKSSQGKRR